MINNINFFTPIRYVGPKTFKQHIQEGVEDYFYLGGKTAYVIPRKIVGNSQEVIIKNKDQNKIKQVILGAIKIISYMTLVIPVIMLVAKAAFRSTYTFHVGPAVKRSDRSNPQQQKTAINDWSILAYPASAAKKSDHPNPQQPKPAITDWSVLKVTPALAPKKSDHPSSQQQKAATAGQSILGASPALARTNLGSTVADLMDRFTKAWNSGMQDFNFPLYSFDIKSFTSHLLNHAERFKKESVTNDQHFGYIEKFDLNPSDNPQIYMRADLHGDLKSLIENIRSLQEQGLLDQNYKCKPGIHLVFLGDYCDRGNYGTQILELLMGLREENPEQVHIIRGNHEYVFINRSYGGSDPNLMQIVEDEGASSALERFYETMPLTTYLSVDQGERREYIQCTHGLFELTMDPAPLLDQSGSGTALAVPKERKLSERVRRIADSNSELSESAKRLDELVQKSQSLENYLTAYNWADVSHIGITIPNTLHDREYALSARDIRHYLDLSSEQHRVMMIFRGHQHLFQHLKHEDKVLVTTLPVGMDCPGYNGRFEQPDRAYIIKPSALVENWKKRAILREQGHAVTDKITAEFELTSSAI